MPRDSVFFQRLVPALLAIMALIMVTLVLFAAGVLLGIIRF